MRTSRRHILVWEDSRELEESMTRLLEKMHGYVVHCVRSRRDALGVSGRTAIDAAVVDLSYGAEVSARLGLIRTWRERGDQFPIFATAANGYPDLGIEVLEAGGDEFLRKPFFVRELVARIERRVRRSGKPASVGARVEGFSLPRTTFDFAGARIYPDLRIEFPGAEAAMLISKQVGILYYFSQRCGTLAVRTELIEAVWGADANPNSKSVDQYIYRLRKLYRDAGIELNAFVTPIQRIGWRIAPAATQPTNLKIAL